jgi:hypothetical protein
MTTDITGADSEHLLDEGWSTPLEAGVRGTIRGFIEALLEEELEAALGRARYVRLKTAAGERAVAGARLGNEEGPGDVMRRGPPDLFESGWRASDSIQANLARTPYVARRQC